MHTSFIAAMLPKIRGEELISLIDKDTDLDALIKEVQRKAPLLETALFYYFFYNNKKYIKKLSLNALCGVYAFNFLYDRREFYPYYNRARMIFKKHFDKFNQPIIFPRYVFSQIENFLPDKEVILTGTPASIKVFDLKITTLNQILQGEFVFITINPFNSLTLIFSEANNTYEGIELKFQDNDLVNVKARFEIKAKEDYYKHIIMENFPKTKDKRIIVRINEKELIDNILKKLRKEARI